MNIQDFKKAAIAEAREYIGSNGLGSLKADDEDYFFEILLSGCPDLREKIALLVRSGTDINTKDVHRKRVYFGIENSRRKPVALPLWKSNKRVETRATPLGVTPLIAAMWKPKAAVTLAKILIENGADINAQSDKGMTPLFCAVLLQNVELVKYLIAHGAEINPNCDARFNCLNQAIACFDPQSRDYDLEQELAYFGVRPPGTPPPDCQILDLLITKTGINGKNQDKLIKGAIETKNLSVVEWLLKRGVSANAKVQGDGETEPLLSIVCRRCGPDVVKHLIDQGANLNARASHGVTAIMSTGEPLSLKILVKAGADINAVDEDGNHALSRNQWGAVCSKALIRLGADISLTNKDGQTPLMLAAERNDVPTVRALLAAGAVKDAKDPSGRFATSYACQLGGWGDNRSKILSVLIDAGVPIVRTETDALYIAVRAANISLTINLLKLDLTLALTIGQLVGVAAVLENIAKTDLDLFNKGFLPQDEAARRALFKIAQEVERATSDTAHYKTGDTPP